MKKVDDQPLVIEECPQTAEPISLINPFYLPLPERSSRFFTFYCRTTQPYVNDLLDVVKGRVTGVESFLLFIQQELAKSRPLDRANRQVTASKEDLIEFALVESMLCSGEDLYETLKKASVTDAWFFSSDIIAQVKLATCDYVFRLLRDKHQPIPNWLESWARKAPSLKGKVLKGKLNPSPSFLHKYVFWGFVAGILLTVIGALIEILGINQIHLRVTGTSVAEVGLLVLFVMVCSRACTEMRLRYERQAAPESPVTIEDGLFSSPLFQRASVANREERILDSANVI